MRSQLLARNTAATPEAVVAHFGAMQAQDYLGALWAVGLRSRAARESDVERAIEQRRIVRCWPMRGTLHFVAALDARWMIDLLAPRVLAKSRTRLERDFELDRRTLRRCHTVVERAMRGTAMTRPELYAALDRGGVATDAGRGLHILFALAHERLICFGPRRGKQPTFVLFDEWLPESPAKEREEALATVARRYLAGHAPATVADFAWWTGLTLREAKEAFALAAVDGGETAAGSRRSALSVHLLPPFDEYSVGYRDRADIIDPQFTKRVNAGGGMLNAIVVVNGVVAGTWKRRLRGSSVEIDLSLFKSLEAQEETALKKEAERYRTFLDAGSVTIS